MVCPLVLNKKGGGGYSGQDDMLIAKFIQLLNFNESTIVNWVFGRNLLYTKLLGIFTRQCGVQRRLKTWFQLRWQTPCRAVTTRSNFSEILKINIPFAHPLGWDMGCILWVQTLIYIPFQPLYTMLYWSAVWRHSTVYHLRWIRLYMYPNEPRVETNPCGQSNFSNFSSVQYA